MDRYGITEEEVNDDERFVSANRKNQDDLVQTQTTSEAEAESESISETVLNTENDENEISKISDLMSPGEKLIFKRLLEMAADIKVLKSLAVDTIHGVTQTIKSPERLQLLEIGLPLKEVSHLGKFEYEVTKEEFRTKAVSICHQ